MKQLALGLAASLVSATALLAQTAPPPTQTPPPQNPPAQTSQTRQQEQTLTGCLVQGSGPTVFILENARVNKDDMNEKARSLVIVSAGEDLSLKENLNHQVRVTGSEIKAMAAAGGQSTTGQAGQTGQKPDEKTLPRFSAKSVSVVADRCTPIQ